jgi:hypothetical protein
LYLEIHQTLADVESYVMSSRPVKPMMIDNAKTKKKEEAAPGVVMAPPPAIGDARLDGLLARLIELDARITYRTYLEQWQIDNSFANLSRAAELQALSGYVTPEKANEIQQARSQATQEAAMQAQAEKNKAKAKPVVAPAPKAEPAPAPASKTKTPPAAKPAPAVEAPAPEAPAPEAPAPEAPAAEAPAVEAPAAEAPAVEAPAVEAPPEL